MNTPRKPRRIKRGATVRDVGGRPPAELDLKLVEDLASLMCTDAEIASGLGLSRATIARRKRNRGFREALERGRDRGRMSLRRWQFEAAKRGNITAQIWLGKQYLGQKDKVQHDGIAPGTEGTSESALERLFARLDRTAATAVPAGTVQGPDAGGS